MHAFQHSYTAALNRENYRYTCQHVCNVCRMRPVICLIQRLYVRLHGSKVRVDRRTLLRVLHYSFQNASSAQCRTALKRLAADTYVTYIALLQMPIDVYDKPKFIETCEITQLWIVDPWRRSFFLSPTIFDSLSFHNEILFFPSFFFPYVVLNMVVASKKVFFGGKYNYLC